MNKKIILAIGIIIMFGGIFIFTNSRQSDQAIEQEVLRSTLDISRQYVSLRYQTDNVLINAKDYGDYDTWQSEMLMIIKEWEDLENSAHSLENISTELAEEKVGFNFFNQALAYTKEEVSNVIDRAPMGKKITTLTKHLGVDAKMAQLILNETQNMISREAYGAEGDVFQKCENRATIVKNASKVTVFVGTIALTGGTAAIATSGALAKTAVVVSGADLALEITSDTATMALGDKNKISSIAGDVRKITEPAAAILMVSTLPNNLSKGIDKLTVTAFGADQLNSTIQSGSVIGIKLPIYNGYESLQKMQISLIEQQEIEKWIQENSDKTMTSEENIERMLIELGLNKIVEQNTKNTFKIDGEWTGTLTYTNFTPDPETLGDDHYCQSNSGLPITAPLKIQVTAYEDNTIYNAVVSIAGGAYCEIYPDGWDKFSSSWKRNESDGYTMIGGGPIRLTKKSVSITLPNGYSFIGRISDNGMTISGEAKRSSNGPGGGTTFFHWSVSRN